MLCVGKPQRFMEKGINLTDKQLLRQSSATEPMPHSDTRRECTESEEDGMSEWRQDDVLQLVAIAPGGQDYWWWKQPLDRLNALEAEVQRLKAKAALADSLLRRAMDGLANSFHGDSLSELIEDVVDYDALKENDG